MAKQISETTSQIDTVSKQINETTSQIGTVSKQINETSSQIAGFAKTISETTDKINDASKQMNETTGMISEASKQMNATTGMINEASKKISETSGLIGEASKQMNGFSDTLNGAKSDIDGITKIVDDTKTKIDGAKNGITKIQGAVDVQASSADLSPIGKIGAELSGAFGSLKAKLEMPKFDDSKFSDKKFDEITKKFRFETTYEQSDAPVEDDDEFADTDIISSMEIDAPNSAIPSDDDLMADVPDVITAPVFEETKQEPEKPAAVKQTKAAKPETPDNSAKAERPGLDSDFEDFFLTEPKDDDLSGDIPLINMEGVGIVDDFSLDASPEPAGADFDITPIDKTAKAPKGDDLGADIFDIVIDPAGADDDTLANMMAEASATEKAANKDLTPEDLNFSEEDTLPSNPSDDFGEFADLFAAGSKQTTAETPKNSKPAFKKQNNNDDDPWNFGSGSDSDNDLSADSDLADLFMPLG